MMTQAVLVLVDRFSFRDGYTALRAAIRKWRQRARGRNQLALFNDAALKDIGLTRIDAHREINKPFWRS